MISCPTSENGGVFMNMFRGKEELCFAGLLIASLLIAMTYPAVADEPTAIPTFHCLVLYLERAGK